MLGGFLCTWPCVNGGCLGKDLVRGGGEIAELVVFVVVHFAAKVPDDLERIVDLGPPAGRRRELLAAFDVVGAVPARFHCLVGHFIQAVIAFLSFGFDGCFHPRTLGVPAFGDLLVFPL